MLLAPLHMDLSLELLELPHGMVVGFQEQASQESGNGSPSFIKALVQKLEMSFCHILLVKQSQSPDPGEVT